MKLILLLLGYYLIFTPFPDSPCRHQPPHASTSCNFDDDTSISCSTMCNEGYAFDMNSLEENQFLSVYDDGSVHYSCPIARDEKFMQFIDSFTLPQCGGRQLEAQ